jgi:ankyrin repeat protein
MSDVSPILKAVYEGNEAELTRLLASEPQLDVFEAAALGDESRLVALLGEDAAAPARRSPDGFTPLHLAAYFEHPEAVRVLLAGGAEVSIPADNASGVYPLHSAAARSNAEISRLLLDAGAEVGVSQEGGWTPLHSAAHNGAAELVDLLLERGADPKVAAADGRTPVDMAAEEGHEQVLDRLRAE